MKAIYKEKMSWLRTKIPEFTSDLFITVKNWFYSEHPSIQALKEEVARLNDLVSNPDVKNWYYDDQLKEYIARLNNLVLNLAVKNWSYGNQLKDDLQVLTEEVAKLVTTINQQQQELRFRKYYNEVLNKLKSMIMYEEIRHLLEDFNPNTRCFDEIWRELEKYEQLYEKEVKRRKPWEEFAQTLKYEEQNGQVVITL